jgi:cell wall-associated NlpC family hydrolase
MVITTPSVTGAAAPSFTIAPSANLPQLPPPERPAPSLPTGPNAARPKKLELIANAPLPVFNQILPITPLPADPSVPPVEPSSPSGSLEPSLTYTVVSGDTLFSIARRYGVSVDALRSNNSLATDAIRVGQTLNINAPRAVDAPVVTNIRNIAERYLGITYVYGGSSASGLDCSGFTVIVFNELGVKLPRVSRDQFNAGSPVARENLLEGDLVFFDTTGQGVSHVGIYLSDGEFIHAASNPGKVIKSKLEEKYYAQRYLGARRVLGQD